MYLEACRPGYQGLQCVPLVGSAGCQLSLTHPILFCLSIHIVTKHVLKLTHNIMPVKMH